MKNCKHTVPCGCGDYPLGTPPPCNESGPCAGELCSEVFCEECIVHCQPEITFSINQNEFNIPQGERLDETLQRLFVFLNDPSCITTAAYGLKMLFKTSSSVSLKWKCDLTLDYTLYWQEGLNVYSTSIVGLDTYQIINLIPDTEYTIWLECEDTTCESVRMKIKTLPTI